MLRHYFSSKDLLHLRVFNYKTALYYTTNNKDLVIEVFGNSLLRNTTDVLNDCPRAKACDWLR